MTLLGRKVEPPHRLSVVLGHTLAQAVHVPELNLRIGVALLGGAVKPPCSLGGVFGDPKDGSKDDVEALEALGALDVQLPENELRVRVALFCVHSEHLGRVAVEM